MHSSELGNAIACMRVVLLMAVFDLVVLPPLSSKFFPNFNSRNHAPLYDVRIRLSWIKSKSLVKRLPNYLSARTLLAALRSLVQNPLLRQCLFLKPPCRQPALDFKASLCRCAGLLLWMCEWCWSRSCRSRVVVDICKPPAVAPLCVLYLSPTPSESAFELL